MRPFACEQVSVAVVIPAYGHSVWVVDAISSALQQSLSLKCAVVVVIDGDLDPATLEAVETFVASKGGQVTALWTPNRGLSAARNAGIERALAVFPRLEAIYFLDADNTLTSHALDPALARLRADSSVDYIYPHLQTRGIESAIDKAGTFSVLALLRENYIDAGSLVRAGVFREGFRFDEQMRQGYEDWDFWLTLAGQGLRGRNEPTLGLRYMRRPESMLSNTTRDDAIVRDYITRKHSPLFLPRKRCELEHAEAPRYTFIDPETLLVTSFTDYREPSVEIELDEYLTQLWTHLAHPSVCYSPPFIVSASAASVRLAKEARLFDWLLWRLELGTRDGRVSGGRFKGRSGHRGPTSKLKPFCLHFMMLPRDLIVDRLRGGHTSWIGEIVLEKDAWVDAPVGTNLYPKACVQPDIVISELLAGAARNKVASLQSTRWSWRSDPVYKRGDLYRTARLNRSAPLYPRAIGLRTEVAISAPDIRPEIQRLAADLQTAGASSHLFIPEIAGDALLEAPEVFKSLGCLPEESHPLRADFLGSRVALAGVQGQPHLTGLLAWADVVINAGVSELNVAIGALRRVGVTTATLVREPEASLSISREMAEAVAFEHAYDFILTGSENLAIRLNALGIPDRKLLLLGDPASLSTLLKKS